MSFVAEFARDLFESSPAPPPAPLIPANFPSQRATIYDVRAVICDVYGTLINYWKSEFKNEESKAAMLDFAFEKTIERFGLREFVQTMNPDEPPSKTLKDLYHGLIALNHDKLIARGTSFPEVKIEDVWLMILMMVRRHGYEHTSILDCSEREMARCMAYFYNFHTLGRGLFPGVADSLENLKKTGIKLGIVSNAQFYTLIDLSLQLRAQTRFRIHDYLELFDLDLCTFSFEQGVAKPHADLWRRLYDTLYEYHILPEQTVFVGNDLAADIKPAQEAGMKTALFAGNRSSTFMHGLSGTVLPDIVFTHWDHLPGMLSFYEEKTETSS